LKIDYKYYIEHQIYNPIVQLFGLFVEQLPGYVKSSKLLTPEEKEDIAGDLVFKSIYSKCDSMNKKLYTHKFASRYGFTVQTNEEKETMNKIIKENKTVETIVSTIQKKQTTLNFGKLDAYLKISSKSKK